MPRKRKSAQADDGTVSLKLVQNAFVNGQFAPAGTEFTFSKEEADRRLSRTQLWVYS